MATASSGSESRDSGDSGKSQPRIRRAKIRNGLPSQHSGQRSRTLDGFSGHVTYEDLNDFCSSVEDKEIAKKAVAIVIEATQSPQSIVSLCTMVSELFIKKQRLEVQNVALKKALASARSTSGMLPQVRSKATQAKVPARPLVDRSTSPKVKSIRVLPYSCSVSTQTDLSGINQPLTTTRGPHRGSVPTIETDSPQKSTAEVCVALPEIPGVVTGPQDENKPRSGKYREGKDSPPVIPPKRVRQRSACPVLQSMCMCCTSRETDSADSSTDLHRQEWQPSLGSYVRCGQLTGVVKFIGSIDQSDALYVGLHLDFPVGHHDGSIRGVQFFHCPQNYGAFVPLKDVIVLTNQRKVPRC